MEINGIAHIQLTVNRPETCMPFWEKLCVFMGMTPVIRSEAFLYCVGGRTAVAITPAEEKHRGEEFVQTRIGLHHVCFRARERGDVDAVYEHAKGLGAKVVHSPEDGAWAPGYYSVLFEDPDGIRIEVNHVPGRGLLGDKPKA